MLSQRPLAFAEIRDRLSTDSRTLRRLMRAGLPHRRLEGAPMFDWSEVARWLIATGRAVATTPAGPSNGGSRVATTVAEVARHFRVAVRTVHFWLKEDGFPGKAGSPGRQDGHFPLEEIQAWLGTRGGEHNEEIAHLRLRRMTARTEREELKLAKTQASLAPRDEILAAIRNMNNQTAPLLDRLVDSLMKDAPPKLPAAARKKLRQLFASRISEAKQMLAETIAGDKDEQA